MRNFGRRSLSAITESAPSFRRRARMVFSGVPLVLSLGALAVSITTYATTPSPPPPSPLLLDQAQRRATDDLRQIANESFGSLAPHLSLEPQPVQKLNCRAPNGLENGHTIVAVTFTVNGLDPARDLGDYFLVLRAWLRVYGWDIRTDIYEPRDHHLLNATRDGYLLNARTDENGVTVLSNSSPCADPS